MTARLYGTGVSGVQRIKAMMKPVARIPLLVSDPRLPTPRVSMVIPAIGARTAARPERWCGIFLDHCAADGLGSVHRELRPSVRGDRRGDRDGLDPGDERCRMILGTRRATPAG
jgi:hypothetical protein